MAAALSALVRDTEGFVGVAGGALGIGEAFAANAEGGVANLPVTLGVGRAAGLAFEVVVAHLSLGTIEIAAAALAITVDAVGICSAAVAVLKALHALERNRITQSVFPSAVGVRPAFGANLQRRMAKLILVATGGRTTLGFAFPLR